jgi:hypothetical protein
MQSEGKKPEGVPKKYPSAFKAYGIIVRWGGLFKHTKRMQYRLQNVFTFTENLPVCPCRRASQQGRLSRMHANSWHITDRPVFQTVLSAFLASFVKKGKRTNSHMSVN